MDDAQKIISFITEKLTNEDKLGKISLAMPDSKPEAEAVGSLLSILHLYNLKGEIAVDFSMARGLDYYTGIVCEAVIEEDGKRLPTIVGGGRYDDLIGIYSKAKMPAVGFSIGISRIFDIIGAKHARKTNTTIYIAQIGAENSRYAIETATKLRSAGIYTDLDVTTRGISKQLEYASSLGVRYVAIIGRKERGAGKVRLRDMQGGTEELLDVDEVIGRLKR